MFKLNQAILDITNIEEGPIKNAFRELGRCRELTQESFVEIDAFDLMDWTESDSENSEAWFSVMSSMKEANIFKFTLLYWW